mmetsp:Transcript_134085/g.304028  ORF Transcript_134085/g.304028 Transcript_134085/m.304028 type:complete len:242 (-) Transcript_134085:422-1147(-)
MNEKHIVDCQIRLIHEQNPFLDVRLRLLDTLDHSSALPRICQNKMNNAVVNLFLPTKYRGDCTRRIAQRRRSFDPVSLCLSLRFFLRFHFGIVLGKVSLILIQIGEAHNVPNSTSARIVNRPAAERCCAKSHILGSFAAIQNGFLCFISPTITWMRSVTEKNSTLAPPCRSQLVFHGRQSGNRVSLLPNASLDSRTQALPGSVLDAASKNAHLRAARYRHQPEQPVQSPWPLILLLAKIST